MEKFDISDQVKAYINPVDTVRARILEQDRCFLNRYWIEFMESKYGYSEGTRLSILESYLEKIQF